MVMKANVLFNFPLALLLCCACVKEQPGGGEEGKLYELTGFTAHTDATDAKSFISVAGGTPKVYWYGTESVTVISSKDGASAVFRKDDGESNQSGRFDGYLSSYSSSYYIGYPSKASWTLDGENLKFRIPQTTELSISASNCLMSMAYLTNDKSDATFYNLFAVLQLTFTGSGQDVRKIEIHDLKGDPLWGEVSIPASILEHPETYNADDWWEHMTITDGSSKLILTRSTEKTVSSATNFFVPVPPGALAHGVRVVVYKYDEDKDKHVPIDEFCSANLTMERSVIMRMPTIALGEFSLLDVDGENNETANCYIADRMASLSLKFCATKGNGAMVTGINSVEDLWETQNGSASFNGGAVGYLIKNVAKDKGCIKFNVLTRPGNAVIAARDSNNDILWSWHIWMPAGTPETVTVGSTDWMDRNLGATTASNNDGSMGFLYQWGRKDPFTGPYTNLGFTTALMKTSPVDAITSVMMYDPDKKHSTATMDWSIKNPTVIVDIEQGGSWDNSYTANWGGDTKTMYDPCPAGWRVAAVADFDGLTKKSLADWDITHHWFNEQPNFKIGGTGRRYYATGSSSHIVESSQTARYWARDFRGATANQAFEYTGGGSDDAPTAFQQAQTNKYICMGIRCVKE